MQQPYAPVGGTPLLPLSYVIAYFCIFLLLLTFLYLYFHHKKRPVLLWHKVKLLIIIAFILKVSMIAGVSTLAVYWLVPTPTIVSTTPGAQEQSFSPIDRIEVVFDRPVGRGFLEKSISPETPGRWVFENSLYTTHLYRRLVFYPTYSLHPGTIYTVRLSGIRNLINISKPYHHQFTFTTQTSPKVVAVSPVSGQRGVDSSTAIKITLDKPNYHMSEFYFQFTPSFEYSTVLDASKKTYTITPKTVLIQGTEYNLKIQRSDIIVNLEDSSIVERNVSLPQYDGNFSIMSPPKEFSDLGTKPFVSNKPLGIISFAPQNGWSAINVHSPITVTFDQAVDQLSAQQNFSISPKIDGQFSWDRNTLIFTPQKALEPSTVYTIVLAKGIRTLTGTNSKDEFKSDFSTQDATIKLAVPAYLQQYTLSCEIASLRMALNYRGANVGEDDLIPKVGLDTTPHDGDVWGNPNNAFVGNIKGTQMVDGYGVHWGPIAKAARSYRDAKDFQGWNIEQLTEAIASNNPVIIWVYSHFGTTTSWKTPDGISVYAVRDEHAVVAVGFVGPQNNPTEIIINDPLSGQVYWSRADFDRKWDIFGRSGVVVY